MHVSGYIKYRKRKVCKLKKKRKERKRGNARATVGSATGVGLLLCGGGVSVVGRGGSAGARTSTLSTVSEVRVSGKVAHPEKIRNHTYNHISRERRKERKYSCGFKKIPYS